MRNPRGALSFSEAYSTITIYTYSFIVGSALLFYMNSYAILDQIFHQGLYLGFVRWLFQNTI